MKNKKKILMLTLLPLLLGCAEEGAVTVLQGKKINCSFFEAKGLIEMPLHQEVAYGAHEITLMKAPKEDGKGYVYRPHYTGSIYQPVGKIKTYEALEYDPTSKTVEKKIRYAPSEDKAFFEEAVKHLDPSMKQDGDLLSLFSFDRIPYVTYATKDKVSVKGEAIEVPRLECSYSEDGSRVGFFAGLSGVAVAEPGSFATGLRLVNGSSGQASSNTVKIESKGYYYPESRVAIFDCEFVSNGDEFFLGQVKKGDVRYVYRDPSSYYAKEKIYDFKDGHCTIVYEIHSDDVVVDYEMPRH